ncbi:MAG: SRPBCC family protein [Gaiellaceae bacterium]
MEPFVLHLVRGLPVPRAVVYRALTDPAELAVWWGPYGFTAPSVDFEPRVGGGYRIAMQPPDGDLFHLEGEFLAVEPSALLACPFRWDPPTPMFRRNAATPARAGDDLGATVLDGAVRLGEGAPGPTGRFEDLVDDRPGPRFRKPLEGSIGAAGLFPASAIGEAPSYSPMGRNCVTEVVPGAFP